MAKPPETPPHSDIDGADQDFHAGERSRTSDPGDAERLARSNDEARAKPPSESGTGATGG